MEESARFVQPTPEKVLLSWTAASRPFKPQSKQLFSTIIVIVVLISLILILAGEWMLIAVLAAMVFAYYVWSTIPPEQIDYAISTRGVRIAGVLYPWEALLRWWIDENSGSQILFIDTLTGFPKRLHLMLDVSKVKEAEEIMLKNLLSEKPLPTTSDKMSSWLSEKFPLEVR